jgi:hypothetical protein
VFNWSAAMWPSLPRPATPFESASQENSKRVSFYSEKLGAKWEYVISVPPGYSAPENAQARYPVVFLLHGYGMDPGGFAATSIITDSYTTDTDIQLRPVIFVYPQGRCCFHNTVTGAKDCRNIDDTGKEFQGQANWQRDCHSGTFWVNRTGYTASDATLYGDAFFEMMGHVDSNYRTLAPAEVEAR